MFAQRPNRSFWAGFAAVLLLILLPGNLRGADIEPGKPSRQDKCPVCGMFVYKYPDWVSEIIFKDGKTVFFDGPKDMFKYYLNLNKGDVPWSRHDESHRCIVLPFFHPGLGPVVHGRTGCIPSLQAPCVPRGPSASLRLSDPPLQARQFRCGPVAHYELCRQPRLRLASHQNEIRFAAASRTIDAW